VAARRVLKSGIDSYPADRPGQGHRASRTTCLKRAIKGFNGRCPFFTIRAGVSCSMLSVQFSPEPASRAGIHRLWIQLCATLRGKHH
jgi:hypothetical protein